MKPDVELHIDELVLVGFPATDGERIASALRQQLLTLVRDRGMGGVGDRQADHLDLGALKVGLGASPGAIGRATAAALHGALKGGGRA